MKTLNQFLEQGEPAKETEKEDPKVKQAQKKDNLMKRRVLMTKMRALRQGATGIMASYEPKGEELKEYSPNVTYQAKGGKKSGKLGKSSVYSLRDKDESKKEFRKSQVKDIKGGYLKTEEKKKGLDGKECWDGYKLAGTKKKGGKTVDNCVKVNEGVMKMIKSIGRKKKEEKKPEKAMDAGARVRRKLARRLYADRISGSEDNVPDNIREEKKKGRHPRDQKELDRAKAFIKKNPNFGLVEPKDGVDSAKEVNRATRKAAFRPFNKEGYQRDPERLKKDKTHSKQPDPSKDGFTGIGNMSIKDIMKMNKKMKKEEVQVNEASRGEKEVNASDLKKVGRRNINRFETGTVKRTETSGGRRPTSKTVTLANPKPGYGKRTDHYKKNKLSAPSLGRHGTSSETEKGPQKHHTQGVEYHDAAQKQRRQEHKARRGVKTKGTVAADIKKSLKEEDKAYQYVVSQLKKKYGDGVLTKGDKIKPKTAAQKKAAAAHQAKVDRENAAERAKDPSQGRYPKGYSNRGSD